MRSIPLFLAGLMGLILALIQQLNSLFRQFGQFLSAGQRRNYSLATVLAETENIEGIPAQLDWLSARGVYFPNQKHIPAVRARLTELLPNVSAEQTETWTENQTDVLRRTLRNAVGSKMLIADKAGTLSLALQTLRLIDRFGNEKDLRNVERIAVLEPKSEMEQCLKEAAEICLPRLRAAIEANRQTSTLLRPSLSSTQVETLLRPATNSSETPVEELLRPGSREV